MAGESRVSVVGIAGISGKLGQLAAEDLLATSDVKIQGLCRDKSKVASSLSDNDRVTIFEGQSDDLEAAREAVRGCQVVICTYLGPDELMIDGQKKLIDACVAEKVERYMASDYTLDYQKLALGELPSKDPMMHVMKYLEDKPIKGIHVMIGAFIEVFWHYLGMWDAKAYELKYWGTGDEKWDFSTYENTAQWMTAVALDPSATGVLKFRGDFISCNEIAGLLEKKYGERPKMSYQGSMEELRKKVDDYRAKGNLDWTIMPYFYIYFCQNGQTWLDKLDHDRYSNIKPESVKEFLEKNDVRENPLMTRDYLNKENKAE